MNPAWSTRLAQWWVVALAGLAGLAVMLGGFDINAGVVWLGILTAVGLTTGVLQDARWRIEGTDPPDRPWAASEGPLLWIVGAWAITRLGGPYGAYLIVIPAGLVALLVAMFPRPVWIRALVAAGAIELGLLIGGRIAPVELLIRVVIIGGATWGLSRLSSWAAWQAEVDKHRADRADRAANQEARREFGLLTAQTPAISTRSDAELSARPTVGQIALDHVEQAFVIQVGLLRRALGASTVAVLWCTDDDQLSLRAWDSVTDLDARGPWSQAAGIPASVLREGAPVAVAPMHPGGLPYHPDDAEIGAVLAVPIEGDAAPRGVLCVDGAAPFEEAAREAVVQTARALAHAVDMGRELKATDVERTIVQRICAALKTLNASLGMDAAVQATLDAVEVLVKPDLAALSMVRGDVHVVIGAIGEGADALEDLQFTGDEGLVGQAIAHGRIMPLRAPRRTTQGVFTANDTLAAMKSLLVLPLRRADGGPVAALTVASRAPEQFIAHRRAMLELIAEQLGTKLDLAQAHERLRSLATIDGLTGLNNHRTFQQGFAQMIARARRNNGPLCLLLIDIDHFKTVNDEHGHPFGDAVLRAVAQVIGRAGRSVDLAARYGGEEFAVILEDSDAEGGRRVAERVRAEIEALRFDIDSVRVTASIGLASLPSDATSQAVLIELADKALYAAKHRGRNQVRAWADAASA